MGQKDLTQKNLESYPDVFADLINVLVYKGQAVLREEELFLTQTETLYQHNQKELRNQLQDLGMNVIKNGQIQARYMLENQTKPDHRLPLRKAGYHGAIYRRQYTGKELYPVIGSVLYWGRRKWRQPCTLKTLLGKNEFALCSTEYIDDLKINVFEMTKLENDVRKKFQSDIRVIVDYLAEGEQYIPSRQKLMHPEEVLLTLSALTGDHRLEDIIPEVKDEEEPRMCELIDRYEKRGE